MADDAWFVFKDMLVWGKRRMYMLSLGSVICCTFFPYMCAKGVIDRARGEGWFADPRGHPGLFHYLKELVTFALGVPLVQSKPATERAIEAAKSAPTPTSGDGITVKMTDDYLEFQPKKGGDGGAVGVIIIPGALVSPFAYSILARSLAQTGCPTFILRLPFNMAWYGWTTPGKIIKRPQEEGAPKAPTKWVLVGHSLGTQAVDQFTEARPECVNGVVYVGGGRMNSGKLAEFDLPMLVVWGSRDPFTPVKDMEKAMKTLPKGVETRIVEGGNHRGFASYERQPLDWEATITPEEQQRITTDAITDFIKRRIA